MSTGDKHTLLIAVNCGPDIFDMRSLSSKSGMLDLYLCSRRKSFDANSNSGLELMELREDSEGWLMRW